MATDNLTTKYREQLKAKRQRINRPNKRTNSRSMWDQLDQGSFDDEQRSALGAITGAATAPLDLIGAGLWTFADTASFGLVGLADEKLLGGTIEDIMYDEDSAWSSWGGAVGGLAGFVYSPLKLAMKGATKLAPIVGSKVFKLNKDTKYLDDVIGEMTKKGLAKGLNKKQVDFVTNQYRNLQAKAQWSDDIAKNWKKSSTTLMDDLIEKGLGAGKLNGAEAAAVKQMFKNNIGRRPVNDLVDVVQATGKFSNQKVGYFVGNAFQEALAFGLIDSVMEGTRALKEDRAYDWTAPLWGAAIGTGFGALRMIPASGKAAPSRRDFQAGLRTVFDKKFTDFSKVKGQKLYDRAHGHGEILKRYGEKSFVKIDDSFRKTSGSSTKPWIVKVKYRGKDKSKKDMWFDLSRAQSYTRTHKDIGQDALDAMTREALSKSTRDLGGQLINAAARDTAGSLAANWHRMLGGAIIMNARTWYDMYQGNETDINQILPHLFIGAWIQRRGNPAAWDMNPQRMDTIRANLHFLGVSVPNLNSIPDLQVPKPSYVNAMRTNPVMEPVVEKMRDFEHVTDVTDDLFSPRVQKEKGEMSVKMDDSEASQIYQAIYEYSTGLNKHQRTLDDIPVNQAKEIVKIFKKQAKKDGYDIKTKRDAYEYLEDSALRSTEEMVSGFIGLTEKIANDTQKFTLSEDPTQRKKEQLPDLLISSKLYDEISKDDNMAADAIKMVNDTFEKANHVFEHLRTSGEVAFEGNRPDRFVETLETFRKIKVAIDDFEKTMSTGLPETQRFDIIQSASDVRQVVAYNFARKAIETTGDFFDKNNIVMHDKVRAEFSNVLFGARGDLLKDKLVPDASNRHIEIEMETPNKEVEDNARAILGNVIDIFGAKGQYELLDLKNAKPGERGYEPYFKVSLSKIKSIEEFLKSNGILVSNNMPFHSEIVHSILRKRIEGSSLTSADVASLNNIVTLGYGNYFKPGFGKAAGWSVSKIDMMKIPEDHKHIAENVNKRLAEIKKNSTTFDKDGKELGSLVKFSQKKFIADPVELRALEYHLSHGLRDFEPKRVLLEIVNATDTAMPGSLKTLIHQYVSKDGARNPAMLLQWMENLKIISRDKKNRLIPGEDYLSLMNDPKIIGKLTKKIERDSGHTLKDIEANIDSIGRTIESHMSAFEDVSKPMRMTMSKFFDTYKVLDGPNSEYKNQLSYINEILFDVDGNVIKGGIKNLIDNVYVKVNGKETLIKDLKGKSRQNRYDEMLSEVINLVKTRIESKEYPLLQYEDGSLREGTTHINKNNGFDDYESIGIRPMMITAEASRLVQSAFGSGISRKFFTLLEADSTLLNDAQVADLKRYKEKFVELLDRKQVFFEGTDAEISTKGLMLFDPAPEATKFVLRKEDLHKIESAYEDMMVALDKAIANGDINITNKYSKLAELRNVMLGGKLKRGDVVEWIVDGTNNQPVAPHEFIIKGINPDNPNKYVLQMTDEIEGAIQSNKEIANDLKIATTEGIERRLLVPENGNVKPNAEEYNVALRYWKLFKWLKGDTNDWSVFEDAFASTDPTKLLSRIRLYETKNFGRQYLEIFDGIDLSKEQKRLIDKYKDNTKVMIYDDEANYDVKNYMENQLAALGLNWDSILNGRSSDSAHDSISFVSKDKMQYLSFVHGFKNWKTNPIIKPVISSNKNTLLMGKTLFVYDPYLDKYFKEHDVDILMTKTAAKVVGKDWNINVEPLNAGVTGMVSSIRNYVKQIPSESIGVRSENYQDSNLAKRSLSNFNYMDNVESSAMYDRDYRVPLSQAMTGISETLKSHIHINQFIGKSYQEEDSIQSMVGNEGAATAALGSLRLYNEISDRANPMDMNPRIVYNKLFKHYIDPIVNAKSVAWDERGFVDKSLGRYGGKAPLVQSLNPKWSNLLGTVIKNDGTIAQIGEIGLPQKDREARLDHLLNEGYELRFVDNTPGNARIVGMDEVGGRELWDSVLIEGATLGDVHDFLKNLNRSNPEDNFSIAVMDNRYPRTRPNDVTYLSLKGFLDAKMGNSVIVNPFDVLNVFEGDYDADKADYYFMQRKEMADHVAKNMAQNWVQGIEPQDLTNVNGSLPLATFDPVKEQEKFQIATANQLINSKARGLGQTMPRLLKHMTHISNPIRQSNIDQDAGLLKASQDNHSLIDKNLILRTDNKQRSEYIILDFDSNNVHHRLALNAQTQLDTGSKENNMFDEIWRWKRDVFFGRKDEALEDLSSFDEFGAEKSANQITTGDAKRPKIFKKLVYDKESKLVREEKLDIVEQEMLMAIMDNHGRFLQLQPGIFERSGERKNPSYEDVWQRSDTYFNFYQNIGRSIYNKLKYNKSIMEDDVAKKRFKFLFGESKPTIRPSSKWKKDKKKKVKLTSKDYYTYATKSPFELMDQSLYKNIHEGLSGHVVDRIYNKIWSNNIFGDKHIDIKLTGKERELLDNHFDTFLGMNQENRTESINQYIDNVKNTIVDINRSIRMIPKLKRKARKIKYRKISEDFTQEQKATTLEGLEKAIKSIEEDYGAFIDKSYFKTKSIKDLGDGVKYVALDKNADIRDGAIQYYTMRELAGIDFTKLSGPAYKAMNEDIQMLKKLEGHFMADWYGNLDGSKTTFEYGPDKTALNKVEQEYLEQFPSRSTFEEVREAIIDKGIADHGYAFLYKYASPSLNKKRVGVFQNTPIPVPYKSSNRIKVMLRYLANKAGKHDNGTLNPQEIVLRRYATISDRYRNLLEDNTQFQPSDTQSWKDVTKVLNLAKESLDGDVGFTNFQIPSFHRDFTRAYNKYNTIKFNINRSDKYSPSLIADDNVFNFYRDIFKANGDEAEWKKFEERISAITALQLEGRMLDPMTYLATMNSIESDIPNKINEILSDSNFDILKNTVEMQRLRENPLWSVLGGSEHILKGKMSFQPINRLSQSSIESITRLIKQGKDLKAMEEKNLEMDEWNRTLKCAEGDIRE